MADIDDLFTPPNAGAYEREETRVGPPLDYVGEKVRYALESVHRVARSTHPAGASVEAWNEIQREADVGFRYALTAYLALYNMLGMLADHRKADVLLELDDAAFDQWLDQVQREGSVGG